MERTITINGETITLKASNRVPFIYKRHFKKDFFQQLTRSFNGIPTSMNLNNKADREKIAENINTTFFYELVWTLAKNADKDTPKMNEWIGKFSKIAILELAVDASDMILPLINGNGKG